MHRLTEKRVERAKPGRHCDGGGLILKVTASGRKTWVFRFERRGRERWAGLGSLRDVSLADAREAARQARTLLREGKDPIDVRRMELAAQEAARAGSRTFRQCTEGFFRDHAAKWRHRATRVSFVTTMETYVYPHFGDMPVAAVTTAMVLRALGPIWHEKTVTARKVQQRIRGVLDWATAHGFRPEGLPNPAQWKGRLDAALPKPSEIIEVQHLPAMDYRDVPAFLATLRERDGVVARALEVLVLTAARTGEIVGARWEEIKIAERAWNLPAARTKTKQEHTVPLSDRVVEILERLPREEANPFLFIGARAGEHIGKAAMRDLLHRLTEQRVSVHAFRASFRTWAAERTAFPREIVESCLAHTLAQNSVEASYLRTSALERRREVMAAWASYCGDPEDATATVIAMRRGA